MKLLYLTPTYNSYSEVWQQRHIAMLADYISCIATLSPNERKWQNKIPIVDLNPEIELRTKVLKYLTKTDHNKKRIGQKVANLAKHSDVIFVQYLNFAERLFEVLNCINKPVYVHTHGFDVTWDFRDHSDPKEQKHHAQYVTRIKQFNKHVTFIANSEHTKNNLLDIGLSENQIVVKYLGTEIYPERPNHRHKDEVFTLLYLGRFVDFKGPDMVIEAFNMACDKGLKANLIMAGDGPLRAMCEIMQRKSKYKDCIQILGPVSKSKADELRGKSHLFIAHNCKGMLSNQEEAFGVSIIEAMEAELPVLTGANGGVLETIVDQETGLLNAPFDVEAQANNILKLFKDKALMHAMGQAGRQRVIDHFSYEKEEKEFLNVLDLKA